MPRWAPIILLILATLLACGRVAGFGFTDQEDRGHITQNPNLNPPTLAGLANHWRHPYIGLYIPLTYTAWWLLAHLGQTSVADDFGTTLNPWIFHSANLALHLMTACLVLSILRKRLRLRDGPALIGAILFAIHPIQVEAFAWTSGMKDVLCGALAMGAIDQYLAAFTSNLSRSGVARRYVFASALFILATFAKPAAVVLPVMLAVIDLLILHRPWKSVARSIGPWLLVSLAMLAITRFVQPAEEIATQPLWARPLIAADALGFYIYKLVWPFNMTVAYGRSPRQIMQTGAIIWTWIAPAIVSLFIILSRRRALMVGGLLFVAGLLPVLGLTRFTFQQFSTAADRYVYLSMLGIALIVADLASLRWNRQMAIMATAILILLGLRTFNQAGTWSDALTLYQHAAAVAPNSSIAQANCAAILLQHERVDQAAPHAARAVEIEPDNTAYRRTYAIALQAQRRWPSLIEQLEAIVKSAPLEENVEWLAEARRHLAEKSTTSPTTSSAPPPALPRP